MNLLFKNFTQISDEESALVLQMRNSDAVRLKMYNQDIIFGDDHKKWMQSLAEKSDCRYFLVYADDKPIGVVDFTSITRDSCEWGYYLSPNMQLSGFGVLLEYYAIKYAFEKLTVTQLYCAVLDSNKNVYNTHTKYFGFVADEKYSSKYNQQDSTLYFNGLSLLKENWDKWNNPTVNRNINFFKVGNVIFADIS